MNQDGQTRRGATRPGKGWRRLRQNEFLRKGDKFLIGGEWHTTMAVGARVSHASEAVYFRKVRKARAK